MESTDASTRKPTDTNTREPTDTSTREPTEPVIMTPPVKIVVAPGSGCPNGIPFGIPSDIWNDLDKTQKIEIYGMNTLQKRPDLKYLVPAMIVKHLCEGFNVYLKTYLTNGMNNFAELIIREKNIDESAKQDGSNTSLYSTTRSSTLWVPVRPNKMCILHSGRDRM